MGKDITEIRDDMQKQLDEAARIGGEQAQEERDFDRDMARDFGERVEGDEQRVWVDHDGLETALRKDEGLDALWGYSGLKTLKPRDRALPAPLRRLLRIHDESDWVTLAPLLVPVCGVLLVVLAPWESARADGLVLIVLSILAASVGDALLDAVQEWLGERLVPLTTRWRELRAVEALRHKPFVVVTQGKVVENLPSLSWLEARAKDLKDAEEAAGRRADRLDDLAERLRKARKRAGDTGADPQLDRLAEAAKAERDLAARAKTLRGTLQARRGQIRSRLDKLQARVDVEALHEQAEAMTGQAVPSTPERVAADLEVDVADLAKDVTSLQAEIAEQEAHYRAMNEVSAL